MDNHQELLKEIDVAFEKTKKSLGFSSTLDEIDEAFSLKDSVLKDGYVGTRFSRQIRNRMCEAIGSWNNYLHSLIMPNPQNLFNMHEVKVFDEKEKKEIMQVMSRAWELNMRDNLVKLNNDAKEEGIVIDAFMDFWKKEFAPFNLKIISKVREHWKKEE